MDTNGLTTSAGTFIPAMVLEEIRRRLADGETRDKIVMEYLPDYIEEGEHMRDEIEDIFSSMLQKRICRIDVPDETRMKMRRQYSSFWKKAPRGSYVYLRLNPRVGQWWAGWSYQEEYSVEEFWKSHGAQSIRTLINRRKDVLNFAQVDAMINLALDQLNTDLDAEATAGSGYINHAICDPARDADAGGSPDAVESLMEELHEVPQDGGHQE